MNSKKVPCLLHLEIRVDEKTASQLGNREQIHSCTALRLPMKTFGRSKIGQALGFSQDGQRLTFKGGITGPKVHRLLEREYHVIVLKRLALLVEVVEHLMTRNKRVSEDQ